MLPQLEIIVIHPTSVTLLIHAILSPYLTSKLALLSSFTSHLKQRIPSLAAALPESSRKYLPIWSEQQQAGTRQPNGSMPGTAGNKSYLSETISAYSPWGSRSSTPKPHSDLEEVAASANTSAATQRGGDHVVSHRHKLSLRSYPPDCPKLEAQWFHAVDVCSMSTP